jgi:hypothetical protein
LGSVGDALDNSLLLQGCASFLAGHVVIARENQANARSNGRQGGGNVSRGDCAILTRMNEGEQPGED